MFNLNYENLDEVNITPGSATRTYARVGAGIKKSDPDFNDKITQDEYMDGGGNVETDVVGGQLIISLTGDRNYEDDAQNWIYSQAWYKGQKRRTHWRRTFPNGDQVEGDVTMAKIAGPGGDPNSKGEFTLEIHFNGKPTVRFAGPAEVLATVVAGGTAAGTTSATATAGADNSLKMMLSSFELDTVVERTVVDEEATAYTSGEDIPAEVAQWLYVYEVDQYDRIVKSFHKELEAGDITT